MGLGELGNAAECGRVGDSDVGENLAVQLHPGLLEAADQLAIREAREARPGIDPRNPQRAELAPPHAAVSIGEGEAALDGLPRHAVELAPPSDVPFASFMIFLRRRLVLLPPFALGTEVLLPV